MQFLALPVHIDDGLFGLMVGVLDVKSLVQHNGEG